MITCTLCNPRVQVQVHFDAFGAHMEREHPLVIHHINGDTGDNSIENLRAVRLRSKEYPEKVKA